jgi:hypothetical protein
MRLTPIASAADTAKDIPRALNDPVGLRASSFTHVPSSALTSGVHPSLSDTDASSLTGNTAEYRQSEWIEGSMIESGSVPGSSRMSTRSGRPQPSQVVWSRPTSWALSHSKHVIDFNSGLKASVGEVCTIVIPVELPGGSR